jgi:hypothetical protein
MLCRKSTQALEQESGYLIETHLVSEFRESILQGDWLKVESLLPSIGNLDGTALRVRFVVSSYYCYYFLVLLL